MVGLLLPAVQAAREAARSTKSDDDSKIEAVFTFETEETGTSGKAIDADALFFNPQPEPPALFDTGVFGFDPQPEPPALDGVDALIL